MDTRLARTRPRGWDGMTRREIAKLLHLAHRRSGVSVLKLAEMSPDQIKALAAGRRVAVEPVETLAGDGERGE